MKVNDKRKKQYQKNLKRLLGMKVVLGAVGGHADIDLTNAELWFIHEKGSIKRNIPTRAPIRKTFRDNGNQKRLSGVIGGLIKSNGISEYEKIGTGIGETMKGMVKKTVMKRVSPANAESTLARKKGDIPLIDTRQMLNSLESDVQ